MIKTKNKKTKQNKTKQKNPENGNYSKIDFTPIF